MSRRRKRGSRQSARPRLPSDPRRIDWQAVDWPRVDRCLARFDAGPLVLLLAAAADSPGAGHRQPSLILLWLRCLAAPPAGAVVASVSDLPRLLSAARGAAPQVRVLEDCWSADPRLVVRFPVAGQRFRVHPGAWSNPVQALRPVTATAEAIDDFVLERHGFRLTDLLEVALRYSDRWLDVLSDAWPSDGLPLDRGDPPGEELRARVQRIARTPVMVTDAEIAAARSANVDAGAWVTACEYPEQAAAAWKWATRDAAEIDVDLWPGAGGRLGSALVVSSLGRSWPVPASLVVSVVAVAAAMLSAEAAGDDQCLRRMQQVTERRALGAFAHPVAEGRPEEEDLGQAPGAVPLPEAPVAVTVPASRHAFVLGFASGLDRGSLERSLRTAKAAVDGITTEMVQTVADGFDPSGSIFRIVIYGGPLPGPSPRYKETVCIHVDDLISAALDADQAVTGEDVGRELLWQFLEELVSLPGIGELVAWEFADIWQVWLNRGTLNPGGREGIAVHPFVIPDQEAWERAAAWEPVETVMTQSGLAPSWEWSFAHWDEPDQARVGLYGHVFLILAEPPLVLHVLIDKDLASLGIDPAFTLGLADGIRQTAVAIPGVAAVISAAGSTPLLCWLRLEPFRSPGATAEVVGCRLAASGPPPVIDLVMGVDWLEYLAEDPAGGHAVLGRALAEGLRRALHLSDQASEAFMASWLQAVPVAALHRGKKTLPPSFQGRDRLPRSPATAARASRAIAKAIIRSDAPLQAIYVDEGAVGLCTDVILPAADNALSDAVADWSPSSVQTVARCLNDAHAARARREGDLAFGLTAPWGEHWRNAAMAAPEPTMITRPVELLLETLLARTTAGSLNPDAFEIAEAVDLASMAIEVSLYLAATRHRLHHLAAMVHDDGLFTITDKAPETATTASIDIGAYLQAVRTDRLRLRPEPLTGSPVRLDPDADPAGQEFTALHEFSLPGSLLTADAVMKRELGTGVDGLKAVLGTAITWNPTSDDVVEVTRAELRDAAVAWSSLPLQEIEAALDLLILAPAQLRDEGLRYWEQERRRYRLTTRPLISLGNDRLILIPRLIEVAQDIYAAYLLNGRLPWPPSAVPRSVSDAFNNFRKRQNRELERQVLETLNGLSVPYRGNIEPHQAAPHGLQLTGEIDALAADVQRSRLWVCEVKDVSLAASPRTLADRVRKFTEPNGYVNKLLRSLAQVQASPAAAARLLGVPDPDRDWQVVPLMITRQIEPAAFAQNPVVPFVTAQDLATVIRSDTQPCTGHAAPSS